MRGLAFLERLAGVIEAAAIDEALDEALDEAAGLDWGHQVVLGVGLAWAASRTCEERLERLPVPPDAMPGMTNLTGRTELRI